MKADSDMLREFYFSAGQNYTAFKTKKQKGAPVSPAKAPAAAAAAAAAAVVEEAAAVRPAAAADEESAEQAPGGQQEEQRAAKRKASTEAVEPKRGSAAKPEDRGSNQQQQQQQQHQPVPKRQTSSRSAVRVPGAALAASNPGPVAGGMALEAASTEYILFLKQQQDLQKHHNRLEETLACFETARKDQQKEVTGLRKQAAELLRDLEGGSDWNLTSRYNVDNLVKDASLSLHNTQLTPFDAEAQVLELQQQVANLKKLKQDHQDKEHFDPHKVAVNNGLRRLDRVEKEARSGQLNVAKLARVPDTLLIQLEHLFGTPTLHSLLESHETAMEHLLFKLDRAREQREEALEDGEMQLAEKHYYAIVDLYDELQGEVLEKLHIVDKTLKETAVFDKVRDTYQLKAGDEIKKIKGDKEALKQKCEQDTQKLFSLREKIEDVEKQMVLKMAEDCRRSDESLRVNGSKMEACWMQIEACERELYVLERERHREVKKRVEDKEKDEQRRMEFERFCQVCDSHTAHLDMTIRNCESMIHISNLTGDFVQSGFTSLASDFQAKSSSYGGTALALHKEHLTMFRGLFLALGDLTHKKEKKIEDVDKQIQASHINQELCADTLNPNAKRFSDLKKELLRVRDDLEQDVRELKEKAAEALEKFKLSEEALRDAEVAFIHPVIEHQEQSLATRAKMVEFKALAIGHVDSVPIRNEIEDLKRQIASTKQQVENVNAKCIPTAAMLPAIKA
ncbi:73 kDa paraflagellar rod protein [Diplonema papillatum]|nr:73 kDa paraflagellar rod protein [Diplonema papillatum]